MWSSVRWPGLFQLGDEPCFKAQGRDAVAHHLNIFGGAHKETAMVHAVLEREFKVPRVFSVSEGRAPECGQVDALCSPEGRR